MRAAGAGDDAQPGFGEADDRVGRQDAEVGGQGEFEAAAEGERRDGRDGGDGERGEGGEGAAKVGKEFGGSVELALLHRFFRMDCNTIAFMGTGPDGKI